MNSQDKRVPKAVRRRPDGLELDWGGADGIRHLKAFDLRLACPCAACVDEMSGRRIIDADRVPADIRADAVELVGAYGIRIRWSDGHSTGIYTFESLHRMAP